VVIIRRPPKLKASEGKQYSSRRLYKLNFWKILFIIPPEVQDQVVDLLIYEKGYDDTKVS
jgi:hypothetical protein